MELDYRFWQTKEAIKTFIEENEREENLSSTEQSPQQNANVALMSLVTFFTLSKVFQLHKVVGEAGGTPLEEPSPNSSKTGEQQNDTTVPPGQSK